MCASLGLAQTGNPCRRGSPRMPFPLPPPQALAQPRALQDPGCGPPCRRPRLWVWGKQSGTRPGGPRRPGPQIQAPTRPIAGSPTGLGKVQDETLGHPPRSAPGTFAGRERTEQGGGDTVPATPCPARCRSREVSPAGSSARWVAAGTRSCQCVPRALGAADDWVGVRGCGPLRGGRRGGSWGGAALTSRVGTIRRLHAVSRVWGGRAQRRRHTARVPLQLQRRFGPGSRRSAPWQRPGGARGGGEEPAGRGAQLLRGLGSLRHPPQPRSTGAAAPRPAARAPFRPRTSGQLVWPRRPPPVPCTARCSSQPWRVPTTPPRTVPPPPSPQLFMRSRASWSTRGGQSAGKGGANTLGVVSNCRL